MFQDGSFLVAVKHVLATTPIWLYFAFLYLLFVGYRESRMRVLSFRSVYMFTVIVVLISFEALSSYFTMTSSMVTRWLFGLLFGIGLGGLKIMLVKIDVDRKLQFFRFSGSWAVFFIVIIFLVAKNYVSYQLMKAPALLDNSNFQLLLLILMGAFPGMFVGRFLYCCYRFFFGPYTDLSQYRKKKTSK